MQYRTHALIVAILVLAGASWFVLRRDTIRQQSITLDNTLIIGTAATYPPFSFIDNGVVTGYDIDVALEVAKRMGKTAQIRDMSFDALVPATQLGHIHIIASDLTPTPERAQRVLFSVPYFTGDPLMIITKEDHNIINNIADLVGKQVIVNQGYFSDLYISKIDGIHITRLDTISDALLALKAGRVDAFITSQQSAKKLLEKKGASGLRMILINDPAAQESYALAISKKHAYLLPLVNQALEAMHRDGTITALRKKWNII